MQYFQYKTEDFVSDKFFQDWVYHPSEETESFWTQFLQEHPFKKQEIDRARHILLTFLLDHDLVSAPDIEEMRTNIHRQIKQQAWQGSMVEEPVNSKKQWLGGWKIAASLGGLLLLGMVWWIFLQEAPDYQTAFNESKTILLPDSSVVILNANSKLWVAERWDRNTQRVVTLEGEAFFRVTEKPHAGNSKFVVQTEEASVEVLGTQFNVAHRREGVQVVLKSGKVRLKSHLRPDEEVMMKPGEIAAISKEHPEFQQARVDPQKYISWTQQELILDKTSIRNIARMLEDNYGFDVRIDNESLAKRRFSATTTIPLKDVDTLLTLIEKAFSIQVKRQGNTIMISDQSSDQNP